ncbi:MAG: hypothetical protein VX694_01985, partial [Planctomycetota bacterium]|nr:hypothetical protein [Planctomycetota bacterium]
MLIAKQRGRETGSDLAQDLWLHEILLCFPRIARWCTNQNYTRTIKHWGDVCGSINLVLPIMTSKQASNRENQLSEKIFAVATFGFAIIIVTSILFLFLNFSPKILVAINITAAAFTGYQTYRASLIQRRRLEELQKNQLTELREWQERWQQLLQETQDATSALVRMRDGVIMLGKGDQVLLINPAAKVLLGVSESVDMVGKVFSEIVRYPDLTRAIRVAASGEGSQKLKLEIRY